MSLKFYGLGEKGPFHVKKNFGNGCCSSVTFSRICYLLLTKYLLLVLFYKKHHTLWILLFLNFLHFLVLDIFELFIISYKKWYKEKPIKIWDFTHKFKEGSQAFQWKHFFSISKEVLYFSEHKRYSAWVQLVFRKALACLCFDKV